jgi:hypothetical protein
MNCGSLIPNTAEVELVCLRQKAGTIQVELRACRFQNYLGLGADLVKSHSRVYLLLQARKFFCVDERCSRRIFTEQLPGTVSRYGSVKLPFK